jgi:hypothetical protein
MSADSNQLEYFTPGAPVPSHVGGPGLFIGPARAGCFAMIGVTALAAVLGLAIVTALGWVLGSGA